MSEVTAPASYKDAAYDALDARTESKLGLPSGLIAGIRVNGERSNADQVSEAGARGVYQITPTTRELALKKWGVDAYLSHENASEVAGLLLKDSLQRNQNDVAQAVGEYHGGTDRDNWGPKTRAYVERVTQGLQPATEQPASPQQSTFDRVMAQQQAAHAPSQLQALYAAYQGGQMTPEEQQQYEADVRAGSMMLPRGAALKTGAPGVGGANQGGTAVPAGVMQAYAGGQMTPQEASEFEHDVRAGAWSLPGGMHPNDLFGEAKRPQGLMERIAGIPGAIKESITGEGRRTATTDAMPDWAGMPELNQFSLASAKTGLGTLLSDPAETAQIIKANFPGAQVRQDEKGNFLIRSSVNGQEYAIKPGFSVSDIPRALGALAAFTPAGRAGTLLGAGAASAATQGVIEATQAAAGGNFNAGDVLTAGALGAGVPAAARVLGAAAGAAKSGVSKVLGRAETGMPPSAAEAAATAPAAAPPVAAPPVAAPVVQTAPATAAPAGAAADAGAVAVQDVAQTARTAAAGAKGATEELAAMASPSAETQAAAERLGISNYLQSDHVTTSDAYRSVVGVLKSNPTSQLAQAEKEGLANIAKRATDLIDEVGGTTDLSTMSDGIKRAMQDTHVRLGEAEDRLWNKLRETIPKKTDTPADATLNFLRQRADEVGGVQNLSSMEKAMAAKLEPKALATGAQIEVLDALSPAARRQAMEQGAGAMRQPTYALVDDVRRDVGAVLRRAGPFTDADEGLAKKYYGLLTQDQEAVASRLGQGDLVQQAKAATQVRKGMEDDLTSLFGKNLDQSLVPQVTAAMRSASAGDTARLIAVLKATPDSMKQHVVASGLATVFRNAATRGEINFTGFSKWYESLQRNQQAFTAVMSNLPAQARQQIADLYRVSKGISDSLSARIKTGLRSSVLDEMHAPDTLASRMFDLAKHAGKGLAADAVGGHGAGIAMGVFSALKGGAKGDALQAIDKLLTSPEFEQLAKAPRGTTQQRVAAHQLAASGRFGRFARAVGNPRALSNREKWVMDVLQASNTSREHK